MGLMLEVMLYDKIYRNVVSRALTKVEDEVVELYEQEKYYEINSLANENNYSIIIFEINNGKQVSYSTENASGNHNTNTYLTEIIKRMGDNDSAQYYTENEQKREIFVNAKLKVEGSKKVYYYMSVEVVPVAQGSYVMALNLVITTLVSLIIILATSFVLAKDISKPIKNLSEKAKTLSDGEKVVFDSEEYTEVKNLSNALNYAMDEIQKSQEIQKDVVQNVSHELRTPLTMIKSYTELLQEFSGEDPKKRKEHLAIISEQTERLESLIDDMIDLSKLQSKTMDFSKNTYNLSENLKIFENYYKETYEKEGFVFSFEIEENIELTADEGRIDQAITNLINNAINYSLDDKDVTVKLYRTADNKIQLDVIDHGIGISEEHQEKIFERHFRSNNDKKAVAGSGVGLTIVKEILDYHGYQYGVESELGKGSRFYIIFNQD